MKSLFTCDCLFSVYFWTFGHYNFTRAQCALPSLQMFQSMSHTQDFSFSWGLLQLWFPDLHLHFQCHIVLLNALYHLVAHQHFTSAPSFTSMAFHNSLSHCGLLVFVCFLSICLISISFFMVNSSFSTTCSFMTGWFTCFLQCDCLLSIYILTFSHNKFTRAHCVFFLSTHFLFQMLDYMSHT